MQKTDKNAQLIKVAVVQPKLTQEGPAGAALAARRAAVPGCARHGQSAARSVRAGWPFLG